MAAETSTRTPDADTLLTSESVLDYLRRNPAMLHENPDVLAGVVEAGSATRPEGVVDLQSILIDRLREEVESLREQRATIIGASRANFNSQNQVHAAVLALLDCSSFEALIGVLAERLPVLLDIDHVGLVVERRDAHDLPMNWRGIGIVDEGLIDRVTNGRSLILANDLNGDPILFGRDAPAMRSIAAIRLAPSDNAPPTLLVLGSSDPETFHPDMRTELLLFLSQVLERCMRRWLIDTD